MKTSEFIKKVERLGYDTESHELYVRVYAGHILVASVSEYSVNMITTNFIELVPNELLDLCVEYAKTPIEERKSEKKYYLRFPIKVDPTVSYLNYDENISGYSFNNNRETYCWKTQFTQKEIDELPNQDFIKTLIKEEVE